MKIVSLNGTYKMSNAKNSNKVICNANIPGSDFGNLISNKIIENPLICKNPQPVADLVAVENYVFKREFELSKEDFDYDNIILHCDKLDTLCKCYINGNLAFESNNAHLVVEKDIKPFVKLGTNKIEFRLDSAVNYVSQKQKENPLPKNANGTDGAAYIRKASCHFGWDWGPYVPYKYIGNVEIQCFNKKIDNIVIRQNTNCQKSIVMVSANNVDNCYIVSPEGKIINSDSLTFDIENPILWYSRDLNEKDVQPLYTVVLQNDEMTVTKKIGLRWIELNTEKDEFGSNFQFLVNGERVFAKGANLIPFSAIPEFVDNSTVDYYLDLCVKSNFNIIRVWGGGEYASEYLLEKCDELGILVWQDFCFACQMYPLYDDEFVDNVLQEVKQNTLRMSNHPCLALWCGNNEIEVMFSYMPKSSKIVKAYVEFFYHTLPEYIKNLTDVAFIPSSPVGTEPFKDCSADKVGDTHMWNVWHGLKKLDYYEKRYSRFLSEFGLESLPSVKAISTFADKSEFSLDSKPFMEHQKCVGGNKKMMFYLTELFDFPVHFEDLGYLTGIVQAQCVKSATEHFRRNKGRCNGSIFWQLNDVWNCPSWSAVDYEGVPKALMYKAKQFFAPVTVTYSNDIVYLHNDTVFDKKLDVVIKVFNNDKQKLNTTVSANVSADSVSQIAKIKLDKNDAMKIYVGDIELSVDNKINLKKASFDVDVVGNKIKIKSNTYAKNVYIQCDSTLDDNYFSLLPNEEKVVLASSNIENYVIKCENNIEFEKNKVKKRLFRFFYRLKPMNIANAFYYEYN